MNLGIEGKKILVTGASRGLGRATAIRLAQEGAKVAIVAKDQVSVQETVNQLGGTENGHLGFSMDLMQENACAILCRDLEENFGWPDVVVHNLGGTLGVKEPLSAVEDFARVWHFNIGIAIELNRLLLPQMQANKWGRVVHVSSSSAVMADASLAYSCSKAAINNYVKGLGQRMAPHGVIVSGLMPGPFYYEGGHWDGVSKDNPGMFNNFIQERMSIGRLGTPEELSGLIALLCSEQAAIFAGTVVPADGGIK